MARTLEPVSQAIAGSKLGAIAPYIRDEQYTLRDLGKLRARSLGWSLFGAIVAVAGLAGAVALYLTRVPGNAEDTVIGAWIMLVPLGIAWVVIYRAFLGLRAVTGQFPELAAFDARKPILYLRNFANENPEVAHMAGATMSFEHIIGTYFWKFGRVAALGDPKQRRPSGSVSRLFVSDEGWQETVRVVMQQSQAIIIHYVAGANVDWEVDQSQQLGDTPRMVLIHLQKEAGQKRVRDLPAPPALRDAFAASKQKLKAAANGAMLVAVIRDRKGETFIVDEPSTAGMSKMLSRFRRAFTTKPARETQLADVAKLRATLDFWTHLPWRVALIGPAAVTLCLALAALAPGLWSP